MLRLSLVGQKINEMQLKEAQKSQLKEVLDFVLIDIMYSLLLGLDGESAIGGFQHTFKIHDEEGNLIFMRSEDD